MRVFVTGATGYVGNAVAEVLLGAGHAVTGLVRTEDKAKALRNRGAAAIVGDITEPASYREEAASHEAIIHAAAVADGMAEADRTAVDALIDAAQQGAGVRSLIYTCGYLVVGETGDEAVGEDAPTDHPIALVAWRPPHERAVLAAATDTLATASIRPGWVYGGPAGYGGAHVSQYFQRAESEGAASHVGDGTNYQSMIHRNDLAELYCLVLDRKARGVFHGVDGTPVTLGEVAAAASRAAGGEGRTRQIPLEEAKAEMGLFADVLVANQRVIAPRAKAEVGWKAARPPFTEGAERAYAEWKAG